MTVNDHRWIFFFHWCSSFDARSLKKSVGHENPRLVIIVTKQFHKGGSSLLSRLLASSHTRLASPEVVNRGLAESVSKPSIGVGTFKKDFFLLDPSLTSGMSAALMQGHCLRRRPCIKQLISGGRKF